MQNNLKIAIIGIGGVGGYIGAKLIEKGNDVTLIAKDKHFNVLKKKGLKVDDNNKEFIVNPKVINSNDKETLANHQFDIVFITTKSYNFKSACETIKNTISPSTLIIPLANGVNHKKELKTYLDKGIVCDGSVYIISHLKEYGYVCKKADTFYLLFGAKIEDEKFEQLASILKESGLKSKYSTQIEYDCWKKYLFISSMASLTSYFKEPMGYIVNEQKELLDKVLDEIKTVANTLSIPINDEDISKVIKQANNIPYESKTSMQLDFEKEHQTEVDSLCGYIVKEAKKVNLNTPIMEMIYNKLKKAES